MPPKLTTKEFIKRANKVHNNKYDYSKCFYVSSNKKLKILCPEHGEFMQRPGDHVLRKQGCPNCAKNIKMNTTQFIERAKKIYGDKYNYALVDYKGMHTKVKIICPKHGMFLQEAGSHLNGHQCRKCSQEDLENFNLLNYGVKNLAKLQSVKEKTKKTCLEKYGFNSPSSVPKFKKKREETNLKKWQSKNVFQSPKIIKELRKKWPQTKEKIIKTNRLRYGVDYPMQSKVFKKYMKNKWPVIYQKIRTTSILKYGVSNISQLHIKNTEFLNHSFLLKNFLDKNQNIKIEEMMSFFNISRTTCYTLMRRYNVKFNAKKNTFDHNKPAILYYLYDPQEDLYKIGITNRSVEERFGKSFCSNRAIAILEQIEYSKGMDAYLAEQEILEAFGYARCENPSWPEDIGGKTEFFKWNILQKYFKDNPWNLMI